MLLPLGPMPKDGLNQLVHAWLTEIPWVARLCNVGYGLKGCFTDFDSNGDEGIAVLLADIELSNTRS